MSIELVMTDGIFALDGGEWEVTNNIWIVGDDREVIVFDAAHDHQTIVEAIAGRRVTGIVLTHGHNDHINAAVPLRDAVDAPILLLSEQPIDTADDIVRYRLMATVYSVAFIDALASAARARRVEGIPVHLKIDTGMQRVGVQVDEVAGVQAALEAQHPALLLVGVFTHLALADEPDDDFTTVQLSRFDAALVNMFGSACWCTQRTRRVRWPIRLHGVLSFERGLRSTASRRVTESTRCATTSDRRCR